MTTRVPTFQYLVMLICIVPQPTWRSLSAYVFNMGVFMPTDAKLSEALGFIDY